MPAGRHLLSFFFVSSICVACASAVVARKSCDELGAEARDEVNAVIESNSTCSVDADCVSTALVTDCFDSCSRVANASGVAAIAGAKERVNANQCKTYRDRGCTLIHPPCDPPSTPVCTEGRCSER